ncbi:hypothetical protein [Streptomyces sp. NPDC088910]|uniref:hypothetical protein n=1 Tax=Streptomyces sp. NPDC088910 TaxID=3365911 RepID=UPI0037FB7C94
MDPYGQIARRFPLVARFRPACLPLPDRVHALVDLAGRAADQNDQGLASTIFNQSALLASDVGLPDLARAMCHRHANAYLVASPLTASSAIRGLEPLVNLARLQIRAGNTDDGRQRLLDLYEAVGARNSVVFEGIAVPADLTRTEDDRREVRAWLWRVLLGDGTRTLTTTGRWRKALAHIEQHHGVGTRMLDGRQVAVIAALNDSDVDRAVELVATTAEGDPWEQAVTACLAALCQRIAGRDDDSRLENLVTMYLGHEGGSGQTVFDVRLGLTVLDIVGSADHPRARRLVDDLARRIATTRDGYAAREVVSDQLFNMLATDRQIQECESLIQACSLQTGTLPEKYAANLSAGLDIGEAIITRSLITPAPSDA